MLVAGIYGRKQKIHWPLLTAICGAKLLPMYTDAHCHLAHTDWQTEHSNMLAEALARAQASGVSAWIAGGIEPKEWESQKELSHKWPLKLVFGLHPWWVAKATEAELSQGLKLLESEVAHVAGLGEMGLDKHVSKDSLARQRQAFEAQLAMARRHKKPIVLHCVKAHAECLSLLKVGKGTGSWSGIVHRFQGTAEEAKAYLELGLALSVGGPEAVGRAPDGGAPGRLPHRGCRSRASPRDRGR